MKHIVLTSLAFLAYAGSIASAQSFSQASAVVMPLRLVPPPLPLALLGALPPAGGAAVRICG